MLWILVSWLVVSGAVADEVKDPGMMVLCGRRLARAQALICYDISKRNSQNGIYSIFKEDKDYWSKSSWPWIHPAVALSQWRPKRQSGGIADECCLKPCTQDEIRQYC